MDKMSEIDKKAEELLLALQKKGADDIIIKISKVENVLIRYANNEVTIPICNEESYIDLRFGYKNAVLLSSINNVLFDVEKVTEELIKIASQLKEQEVYVKIPSTKFNYVPILDIDEETKRISELLPGIAEDVINRSLKGRIKKVAGTLEGKIEKIRVITSTGYDLQDIRSSIMLNHRCFSNSTSTGQWAYCSRSVKDLDYNLVVEKATQIAEINVNQKKIEPGNYDVIFSPMIFASLMEHAATAASAYNVELGLSFFIGKLNTKVASDKLTLYEDPHDPKSPAYSRFDDECIPTKKKEIIKDGILVTYLHNLRTAKKFGTESTGNAGIVFPVPFNVHVKEGDYKEEEIFKEVKKGLFLLNNWYLRFQNYVTGDFSTILRDGIFLIENGEIKQALYGGRLSENYLNLLNSIEGLTNVKYPIKWWEVNIPTYSTYALARNLRITTAE
jgi:PmbA protein